MKLCVYCGCLKSESAFTDEHIWPDALGGDYLPKDVWRTEVCRDCNSLLGRFVDGEFIRGWLGQSERSSHYREYLAGFGRPMPVPFSYMGQLAELSIPAGHACDVWVGPCGAQVLHLRPDDGDPAWRAYSGGKPSKKKSDAGRAYLLLPLTDPFWIAVALLSFQQYYERPERYVVNLEMPMGARFKNPDRSDPGQAADMELVDAFVALLRERQAATVHVQIPADTGNRMLYKLGLALGSKLLGEEFLATENAQKLRRSMREANFEKRQTMEVHGAGIFAQGLAGAKDVLAWPGGWVLLLKVVSGTLGLSVVTPTGKSMVVMISDDASLVAKAEPAYLDGVIWITVPVIATAVGPISLSQYLAHRLGARSFQELTKLESKRGDQAKLPPCRPPARLIAPVTP